jgi:hypothetical protein
MNLVIRIMQVCEIPRLSHFIGNGARGQRHKRIDASREMCYSKTSEESFHVTLLANRKMSKTAALAQLNEPYGEETIDAQNNFDHRAACDVRVDFGGYGRNVGYR